jgi:hypothetical protein
MICIDSHELRNTPRLGVVNRRGGVLGLERRAESLTQGRGGAALARDDY